MCHGQVVQIQGEKKSQKKKNKSLAKRVYLINLLHPLKLKKHIYLQNFTLILTSHHKLIDFLLVKSVIFLWLLALPWKSLVPSLITSREEFFQKFK